MKVTSHTTLVVGKEKRIAPPGEVVDLDDLEAMDLIERGIAKKYDPATAAIAATEGRSGKIQAAITELDDANEELWTGSGKPKTSAIAEVLGEPVSSEERDEAWKSMQAERG